MGPIRLALTAVWRERAALPGQSAPRMVLKPDRGPAAHPQGQAPYHRNGRMVGYAVLGPDTKPSRASGTLPDGLYAKSVPAEALHPFTLTPSNPASRATRRNAPKAGHPRPPCRNSAYNSRCRDRSRPR
ncbi:DUF6009 family protein [Streptomyces sp. NPDC007205]|uniref:DUF6009 family protein n=1 Tax=Streptomyces sp. NPDC007205 TaxID=3154316 RepID=UPI0033D93375